MEKSRDTAIQKKTQSTVHEKLQNQNKFMLKYKGCWFGRKPITGFENSLIHFVYKDLKSVRQDVNILLNSSSANIVFDQEKGFGGGCFQVEIFTKWCFGPVNIAGEC